MRVEVEILRDPHSGAPLRRIPGGVGADEDGPAYGVDEGRPNFLNPANPFGSGEVTSRVNLKLRLGRLLPSVVSTLRSRGNFERLAAELVESPERRPRLLVVGGATDGVGFEAIRARGEIRVIASDVAIGPATDVVCDAHALPFADGSFDAVVAQALLEHVADPAQVVAEIKRVLIPGGLIYTEIPFLQPVHEGAFDFTRFTLTGHRRLLCDFTELDAGACSGPGSTLAWSIRSFVMSLAGTSVWLRRVFGAATTLAVFWLKFMDRFLIDTPVGIDAACATYFLGRKSMVRTADSAILARYEGAGSAFHGVR